MDQSLSLGRDKGARDLAHDPQGEIEADWPRPLDSAFNGFPINIFHRIEKPGVGFSKVESPGHVRMRKLRSRTCFSNETLFDGVTGNKLGVNDFQRDVVSKVGIERLISYTHGSASQLPWGSIRPLQDTEMLKGVGITHVAILDSDNCCYRWCQKNPWLEPAVAPTFVVARIDSAKSFR